MALDCSRHFPTAASRATSLSAEPSLMFAGFSQGLMWTSRRDRGAYTAVFMAWLFVIWSPAAGAGQTHAWYEICEYIADITCDQFADIALKVAISTRSGVARRV